MSYSFLFKSASKAAAKVDAENEFDERVLKSQPIHEKDKAAALANVNAVIDLMPDDKQLGVSMNGSIYTNEHGVGGVSVACQVNVVT